MLLDPRGVLRLAEDLFGENIVDCIDGDIVAIEFCISVVFSGVSLERLTSVLFSFMEEMLDELAFRLSLELGRNVEEMLLENPTLSNSEILVLEAGPAVVVVFDMTVVIENVMIVEIIFMVVYLFWC